MSFGKNLKKIRLARGYSREFLAININTTASNIEKWEADNRTPPLKRAKMIADFLGVTVSDLLDIPNEKVENIANIRLDPDSQSSIDRIRRMREAGLTEQQIDKAIEYAISMMQK